MSAYFVYNLLYIFARIPNEFIQRVCKKEEKRHLCINQMNNNVFLQPVSNSFCLLTKSVIISRKITNK